MEIVGAGGKVVDVVDVEGDRGVDFAFFFLGSAMYSEVSKD